MELEYDPLVCFGRHLAATRRNAGVSQEALAYDSGMSRSYLSEIERGLRNVALRNICVLAETLRVPPSALLEFDRTPSADKARRSPKQRSGARLGDEVATKGGRTGLERGKKGRAG
ncbi:MULTISPECIES: helix-turn-helix domain-containing protein [Comamonadaceae]|jgi:transcriptional regulator with XRE-family HTH domain|uniref:Multiprotein-bridging factor 1 n=3 Tax=cellular organisms TaxID=131567 RepID=A0A420RY59_GIBIN|nr:helix-turn-helix transcriptional regulator [Hydrogenophaga laconesensis]NCU65449.1 helix-turn-helix transcriptional regulator [Acidovorax sp. 210-6]RKL21949.1 hypothetical protein BFJ72_g14820 [Fusarium proliferatum]SFE85308.1 Helix-turn-helix domain-containing protein [Paracidovorax wautersii]GAO20708.1 helix-turn-helix domain-containing protein [Alicycliphilus sp. B1]MDR7092995.1 transcriptional regulator with XRE-family HTH domain [Hydrogenophaga laconesensis]